jgi:hypothetical protein
MMMRSSSVSPGGRRFAKCQGKAFAGVPSASAQRCVGRHGRPGRAFAGTGNDDRHCTGLVSGEAALFIRARALAKQTIENQETITLTNRLTVFKVSLKAQQATPVQSLFV